MQNRRLNFFEKNFFQPPKWVQKAIFGRKLHFSSEIMRCKNACKMDTINIFGKPESSRTRYIPLALVNSSWNNFYGSFCDVASNWRFAKKCIFLGFAFVGRFGPIWGILRRESDCFASPGPSKWISLPKSIKKYQKHILGHSDTSSEHAQGLKLERSDENQKNEQKWRLIDLLTRASLFGKK